MKNTHRLSPQDIAAKLAKQKRRNPIHGFPGGLSDRPIRPAAVLIPFFLKNHAWQVLFIRRTEIDCDLHSGQVSFPGGAQDPGDLNAESAALREAREELAIAPKDVQILGSLNDFITISNYQVTPFVGTIPWPYRFTPSPQEVGRVFSIPLDWLDDPANRRTEYRELPNGKSFPVIYFNQFDGELLWGATARITIDFLDILDS